MLINNGREKAIQSQAYVVEELTDFRVATAAYRGAEIFESELINIFYTTWIYLGHESEIVNPGDFKSTWIGMQPIILTRDDSGSINAFLNACTHRGSALCREESGHTRAFVCPYHGWSFRPSGELIGMPAGERYPSDFDKSSKGLVRIAKVDSYAGLIFGSLNPQVEPLETFLGSARKHIDYWLGRCAGGKYRTGTPHRYAYQGNWKFQAENVYDGYHPGFVHRSAYNAFRKFEGTFKGRHYGAVREDGLTRGLPGGHGTLELGKPLESGALDPQIRQEYIDTLVSMHGEETAQEILGNRHLLIFPNVVIMDFNIRVIQPRGHDRTEVYSYPMMIDGVREEISTTRLHDVQTRVGTAGVIGADDIEIFHGNQTALQALGAQWLTLSRGLGMEEVHPDGERIGAFSDETPHRAFWRQWQRMMATGG
jgi:nitrite reductase/ring-hydroxylating ferredoxin subunit